MIVWAKPRVDRKTVILIAVLLAGTCVACYLLAPLSRTLTTWLPFASTIYGDSPRSAAADPGSSLSLAGGIPTAKPKSPALTPASTTIPPSNATPPVATVTPSGAGNGTRGRSTTSSASVVAPVAPVVSAVSAQTSTPAPTPSPSSAPATSTFTAHAVDARPPSRLLFAAPSPTLQAQTLSCASTQTRCAGLQKYGAAPSCVYPAFQPVGPITGVGYSMWEYAPGACYYAIGTQ